MEFLLFIFINKKNNMKLFSFYVFIITFYTFFKKNMKLLSFLENLPYSGEEDVFQCREDVFFLLKLFEFFNENKQFLISINNF